MTALRLAPWPRFDELVLPRRGRAHLPRLDAPKVLARLKERFQAAYWRTSAEVTAPAAPELAEKMLAAIACFAERRLDPDAEVMAIAERMTPHASGSDECSWLRLVADERGVPVAIEIKLRSLGFEMAGRTLRAGTAISAFVDSSWTLARALACAADDATYAEARVAAERLRREREGAARVPFGFFFPGEPAWAHEDLDAAIAAPSFERDAYAFAPLLTSITDDARALAFLERGPPQINGAVMWRACDLAAGLAADGALRVFEACLAKPTRHVSKTYLTTLGVALAALEGTEAAEILAGMLLHVPIGPIAVEYFKRFPDLARAVLPTVAAGSTKTAHAARELLAAGAPKDHGPLAADDDVPAILRGPRRRAKLPPFVRVDELPPPRTKDGARLPAPAIAALLEMLRAPDFDRIARVKEALDPASLAELAWALTSAWILAGARGTFAWIPMTLAHLGDGACARKLAPHVREWARTDAKKAALACDALAAMGSDAALLQLAHVADKSRFETAREYAAEALAACAQACGVTVDELADRTVPDLDLSPDGTATLDFGPRALTVTFDETLAPVLLDASGARVAQLPRGTKSDDVAKVKAAHARFKALRADAEQVAASLLRRFESAMIRGRSFRARDFRAHVLGHPLVVHLARRLVWSDGRATFRVAEDGTLASELDAEYTLLDDATVTVPHPLTLDPDTMATWRSLFSDYAIAQPFEQLGRATFTLADDELAGTTLARADGRKSRAGPLLGSLESRGWQKSGNGYLDAYTKTVGTREGGAAHASLSFGPGIDLSDVAGSPDQKLGVVRLRGAASWREVHPVDVSELVRDLDRI